MKKFFLLIALALALPAVVHAKEILNLKDGIAIKGYDPVAFFTDKKAVMGKPEILLRYNGAIYYFASKEHRDLFKKAPAKYEPAFGGYCAYGLANNKLIEIDPEAFQIVDDRLLLQYSTGVRAKFNKDAKGNLLKADQNWEAKGGQKSGAKPEAK